MMASETAALYERILSRLPAKELGRSCNEVQRQEISAVSRAVNDVSAAFAKLEEVQDAVIKLSGGSTAGVSERLLQTLDNTMQLRGNLKRKLKSMLTALGAAGHTKSKRRKADEAAGPDKGNNEEKEAPMQPPAPTVHFSLPLDGDNTTSSVDASWASNATEQNYMDVVLTLTRLSVLERSRHIPAVLAELRAVLPKIALAALSKS